MEDDLNQAEASFQIIRDNLVSSKTIERDPNDQLTRSLLRHNKSKLADFLHKLCNSFN